MGALRGVTHVYSAQDFRTDTWNIRVHSVSQVNVVFLTNEELREIMEGDEAVSIAPIWVWSYPKAYMKTTWNDEKTGKAIEHTADVQVYHFCDEPHPREARPDQTIVWQNVVEPPWKYPDCGEVLTEEMAAQAQREQRVEEN